MRTWHNLRMLPQFTTICHIYPVNLARFSHGTESRGQERFLWAADGLRHRSGTATPCRAAERTTVTSKTGVLFTITPPYFTIFDRLNNSNAILYGYPTVRLNWWDPLVVVCSGREITHESRSTPIFAGVRWRRIGECNTQDISTNTTSFHIICILPNLIAHIIDAYTYCHIYTVIHHLGAWDQRLLETPTSQDSSAIWRSSGIRCEIHVMRTDNVAIYWDPEMGGHKYSPTLRVWERWTWW